MQNQPTITYRNIEPSPAIDDHVRRRLEELERTNERIVGCDVVIEAPQKKKVNAREFVVRLSLDLPGPNIHVSRRVGRSGAAEDVNLAIHKAFDAARRLLKEKKRVMGRLEVKHHAPLEHGHLDRLFQGEGYGFIKADDGKELYFQRDSLTAGSWNALHVGMRLRFREMDGENGPYAVNVAAAEKGE